MTTVASKYPTLDKSRRTTSGSAARGADATEDNRHCGSLAKRRIFRCAGSTKPAGTVAFREVAEMLSQ